MATPVIASTGLKAAMLNAGGFKETMDGAEFRLYAGIVPTHANDSIGAATLLCTIKNGASGVTFDETTTPGTLVKPAGETWSGTNVAGGTATFYRLVLPADTGAASTSAPRVQGTVGVIDANINLSSVGLVNAAPQSLTSYTVSLLGG